MDDIHALIEAEFIVACTEMDVRLEQLHQLID